MDLSILGNSQQLLNQKNTMNGLNLLGGLGDGIIPLVFFDPQYRGIMDKMNYGNEGARQQQRALLPQMSIEVIEDFIKEIDRILIPSGHLMLWIDKFHLVEGVNNWFSKTNLNSVDLITWDKGRFGMGYRTRRQSEYLLILQKTPKRAKGCWTKHNIADVWTEKIGGKGHAHSKPILLQQALIEATTSVGDVVVDPASGGYSVMTACMEIERNFLGCDLI